MNYETYYVFITALISSYEDMVIAALVKKGFQVSPLSDSNQVTISTEDSVCAMLALRIDADKENAFKLHEEIEKVLIGLSIVYYSLVVTESADCCWNISNIRIPKALPPPLSTPITNVRKPNSGLN